LDLIEVELSPLGLEIPSDLVMHLPGNAPYHHHASRDGSYLQKTAPAQFLGRHSSPGIISTNGSVSRPGVK
jgi:hypothetical protein